MNRRLLSASLAFLALTTGACRQTAYLRVENQSREMFYCNHEAPAAGEATGFPNDGPDIRNVLAQLDPGTWEVVRVADTQTAGIVLPIVPLAYQSARTCFISLMDSTGRYEIPWEEWGEPKRWLERGFFYRIGKKELGTVVKTDKPGECLLLTEVGRVFKLKRTK